MHRQNNPGYSFKATSLCTRMLKDKIHVRIFGTAHEIWLLIDESANASLHAHVYAYSGTGSRHIIYASNEESGETSN